MTISMRRRTFATSLSATAVLGISLGLAGCGGGEPDASNAVVYTEPGVNVPTAATAAGGSPATTTPAGVAPAAATPVASTNAAPSGKAEGWGTLKGQIVFGGTPPAPEFLFEKGKAPKDADIVCSKDGPILNERLIVDSGTKGVKNVLVFLSKPTAVNEEAKANAAKTNVVFDQKNCVFEPHILPMMAGSTITLKSSDPVGHNVNASMIANSRFNSLLAANQSQPYTPGTAEKQPSQVVCDVHPWMLAYWMVLDHPYSAVTDAKGNFEIKNVPAGTQKVVVWQESTKHLTPIQGEEVTITANGTTEKSWTLDPAKVKK